ncbi:hypothetical protein LEQ04_12720 [Riemerella anatipestifer]|uniref:hypothetical protein n=1 Tax=Riemerella anatipestifer TaxID=34085 RepID=UPI00129D914A|nr:hypothetical protein [Riemerella anatipestifer]WPC11398.1 hypothetical protein LEQ05_03440 [Riemerella anatipestifer]WPC12916.1 hypothetical protein LEQ03_12220 [Riemerella anatipestifer]WPC15260.1 hypothetical protein LEQ04_12720 [Riemerella anatipestifer]
MKKKYLVFLFLASILTYSQDSIKITDIEEVILTKQDSYKNYQEFRRIFHSQKYNFKKWEGVVSGYYKEGEEEKNINGKFKLTALLGIKDYILSKTNETASKEKESFIKNIVHISFNSMRIFEKEKLDGFYCKKIDDKHWEFLAVKDFSKEVLKIDAEDYLKLIVELDDNGKIMTIKSNLIAKGYQYTLNIDFTQYRDFLAFKKIKIIGNKSIESFNTEISFL